MISEEAIVNGILQGDTASLAKGITLMESSLPRHRRMANIILDRCMERSGNSIRIAITGVPGVGKSTFIDAFGTYLIEKQGKKVAVLAVDPTSGQTGGSILGDKTRMTALAGTPNAFIRPSPSGSSLGGVAAQTRESILLCEAAGYDVILIETVGVGQSETLVHSMVDFFLLLLLPGAGDELQGIKRGIVEMADGIAINKSDLNPALALEARKHYTNALKLFSFGHGEEDIIVEQIDSVTGKNIDSIWEKISDSIALEVENGKFLENRRHQAEQWFDEHVGILLSEHLNNDKRLRDLRVSLRHQVMEGTLSPRVAAQKMIDEVFNTSFGSD